MKKILYFVPVFPRLSETFIEREITKLLELGHLDIHLVAIEKEIEPSSQVVLDRVKYIHLGLFDILAGIRLFLVSPARVLAAYKLAGTKSKTCSPAYLYLFCKSVCYAAVFQRYHPDQIHVHFLSNPSTIVMIASKILNIPFSISAHARDIFVDGDLIPEKVVNSKFISICNDYAWKKCIELSGFKNISNVHRIYHGIDERIFLGSPRITKPNRVTIFPGGTRLTEKKGLIYLIEAARIVKDHGYDFQIDFVGPGPLYEFLQQKTSELDLDDNIIFHGGGHGTLNKDVIDFYKVADMFVLPSIQTQNGDVDGVPTVVIEAAFAKLPIITTQVGSISDLVDSSTGLIVPQQDALAIASAIERLIKDPTLRTTLGERVYGKAIEMFNLNKNIKQLEDLLLA